MGNKSTFRHHLCINCRRHPSLLKLSDPHGSHRPVLTLFHHGGSNSNNRQRPTRSPERLLPTTTTLHRIQTTLEQHNGLIHISFVSKISYSKIIFSRSFHSTHLLRPSNSHGQSLNRANFSHRHHYSHYPPIFPSFRIVYSYRTSIKIKLRSLVLAPHHFLRRPGQRSLQAQLVVLHLFWILLAISGITCPLETTT